MKTLAALLRCWRNGDDRPTPTATSGCVSPSLPTESARVGAATRVGEGDGPELSCSQGCGRPGTCTWECDGDLIFMCSICCTYCNPGGDLDGIVRRLRMQVGAR